MHTMHTIHHALTSPFQLAVSSAGARGDQVEAVVVSFGTAISYVHKDDGLGRGFAKEEEGPCLDDPAGYALALGTSCTKLVSQPAACAIDLHLVNSGIPVGTLVRNWCPKTCGVCGSDNEFAPAPSGRLLIWMNDTVSRLQVQ